jgi:hypothetical protein
MGTVPRQESMPNGPMQHRELLKWYSHVICRGYSERVQALV